MQLFLLCKNFGQAYEYEQTHVVYKCKDEPKLFYRFKWYREIITKLVVGSEVFEEASVQVEIMHESFQLVFTKESSFLGKARGAKNQV